VLGSPSTIVVGKRVQEPRLLPAAERRRWHDAAFTRHSTSRVVFFSFCFCFFSKENLNADVRGCEHAPAKTIHMRVVQAACWCAALVIAATTLGVLFFEFNDPLAGPHPHALPASIALDAMFDEYNTKHNVYGVGSVLSVADTNLLAKACVASDAYWRSQQSFDAAVQFSIASMCNSAPHLKELARSFGPDELAALPPAEVRSVLRRALESGYGENPTASIRNIVAAALDGHDAFERHELVDLGCGRGKVLAVACTQLDRTGDRFAFEQCHGVEHADVRLAAARALQSALQQALRNVSDHKLADRLASVVHIEQGDLRSAELASRLFSRVSVIYMYNTLFGADLDGSIARLIAKHARSRTRIMLHTMHDGVWQSDRFRLLRTFEQDELVWTKLFLLEVL
jgi:hypothetical protein